MIIIDILIWKKRKKEMSLTEIFAGYITGESSEVLHQGSIHFPPD